MCIPNVCLFTENVRDLCHIQMVGTFSCTLCAKRGRERERENIYQYRKWKWKSTSIQIIIFDTWCRFFFSVFSLLFFRKCLKQTTEPFSCILELLSNYWNGKNWAFHPISILITISLALILHLKNNLDKLIISVPNPSNRNRCRFYASVLFVEMFLVFKF